EDELGVPAGDQPHHREAGGLCLGAHDGQVLADERVEERRLPHVGEAGEGDVAGAGGGRGVHGRNVRRPGRRSAPTPPPFPEAPMQPPPPDYAIDYVELTVPAAAAAKRFYGAAFGWAFQDGGPDYVSFKDGRFEGGFREVEGPFAPSSGNPLV